MAGEVNAAYLAVSITYHLGPEYYLASVGRPARIGL
jgi:hypothetical protein